VQDLKNEGIVWTTSIQQLLDRQQIVDVLNSYADCADRCDFDRVVAEHFHSDAVYVYQKDSAPIPVATFFEMAKSASALGAGFIQTMHYLSNIQVRIDGDRAVSQSYILAQHLISANCPDQPPHFPNLGRDYGLLIGARYNDQFEKRQGLWRISKRELNYEWDARIEPSLIQGPLASRRKLVPSIFSDG
jgi:hypothetical protein